MSRIDASASRRLAITWYKRFTLDTMWVSGYVSACQAPKCGSRGLTSIATILFPIRASKWQECARDKPTIGGYEFECELLTAFAFLHTTGIIQTTSLCWRYFLSQSYLLEEPTFQAWFLAWFQAPTTGLLDTITYWESQNIDQIMI